VASTHKRDREGESQLPLPLPAPPPRYDRDSFIIGPTNEAAWRAVEAWREAGEQALVICGPPGAGKTHLATILAAETAGAFFNLGAADAPPPGDGLVVIDDMPGENPRKLLATLEDLSARGRRVALAGAGHPGGWSGGLADLRTRLEAMPRASLGEPDETLLRQVMAKAFRDRQISVTPSLIAYAAPRLARTFDAARAFVALADRAALEEKRKISIALAQKIIDTLAQAAPTAERESAES